MKPPEVRKKLVLYIKDISFLSVDGIIKKNKEKIKDLSEMLCVKLDSLDEVDEYLDYIIDYIDNTNQYFKREGKGKIPYSSLFTFANYDDKFSEFLFNKSIEKKKDPGIAGVISTEGPDNLKDFSISFENNDYDFICTEKGVFFFFSIVTRRIVVQLLNGKVVSFRNFKKKFPKVRLAALYNKVKKDEDKSDTMRSFEIYFKQMKAKVDRGRKKKRTSSR